jgi:hypothetical protein
VAEPGGLVKRLNLLFTVCQPDRKGRDGPIRATCVEPQTNSSGGRLRPLAVSDRSLKKKLREKTKKAKRRKVAKQLERDGRHSREKR